MMVDGQEAEVLWGAAVDRNWRALYTGMFRSLRLEVGGVEVRIG